MRRFRWQLIAAAGTAVVALVVILAVALTGPGVPTAEPAGAAAPVPTTTAEPAPETTSAGAGELPARPLPPARPGRLEIPSIDVRTEPIIDLGLEPDGALEVPEDAVTTGWFTQSPTPGEAGPAIIAAHVDYRNVPGMFHRLHELRPGAEATVHREDGTSVVFTVTAVERYPKAEFPTERVYGNTEGPELRLITCGGAFNRAEGEYLDNVVAYARMTGTHRATK
ncbi:class F sortase [Amycolatopsis cihanbeyliensis]|uniref:Sortase family protein n=1 Tax=Amycolatopsis cihanbeyliensis TaxID=1128664 RepID=A0A542DLV9_AMYCI|nr:class F sortase [Amycolatopsis cihanbeyliensis]TQJ04083.1 sortase family protein [Amycolatopsis cihanbeyliensis]